MEASPTANTEIPTMQWAISCPASGKMQVKRIPVPKPQSGEVLIKVMAAPVNPSDLGFMKGFYDEYKLFNVIYPNVPGWEGAGIVVQSGGGYMGWRDLGKRVAFTRKVDGDEKKLGGCFQQYCIANALHVTFLPASVDFDHGSMSFVNPITAWGLRDRVKALKANAAIQTGAAGQVGQMLIKLCK